MTTLTLDELAQSAGRDLGTGGWHLVDQVQVDRFAEATGDRQWIHVDPVASAGGPFGRTVAHGYLTLSLLPVLVAELLTVVGGSFGVNYGIERIRFPTAVPVGSWIRLHASLGTVERKSSGIVYHVQVSLEVDGEERPALVGEVVYLAA